MFFEGVPPSGDHFRSSKGAVGWPWWLGDDFVTIVDGFGLAFGTSQGSLLRAFGCQKLNAFMQAHFLEHVWLYFEIIFGAILGAKCATILILEPLGLDFGTPLLHLILVVVGVPGPVLFNILP